MVIFQHFTVISRLNTHPFKYASYLSAQFFWQKSGFVFYYLNMSCKVIFRECMNFLHLTFNVNLLMFHWNVSNNRHSSSYICPTSVWTLEQSHWTSMWRTMLCRAAKPLKLVALSDSTNVSIDWISWSIGGSSYGVVKACPSTSSLNENETKQNQRLHEHPNLYSSRVS